MAHISRLLAALQIIRVRRGRLFFVLFVIAIAYMWFDRGTGFQHAVVSKPAQYFGSVRRANLNALARENGHPNFYVMREAYYERMQKVLDRQIEGWEERAPTEHKPCITALNKRQDDIQMWQKLTAPFANQASDQKELIPYHLQGTPRACKWTGRRKPYAPSAWSERVPQSAEYITALKYQIYYSEKIVRPIIFAVIIAAGLVFVLPLALAFLWKVIKAFGNWLFVREDRQQS